MDKTTGSHSKYKPSPAYKFPPSSTPNGGGHAENGNHTRTTSKDIDSSTCVKSSSLSDKLNPVWNHTIEESTPEQEAFDEAREKRVRIEELKNLMKTQLTSLDMKHSASENMMREIVKEKKEPPQIFTKSIDSAVHPNIFQFEDEPALRKQPLQSNFLNKRNSEKISMKPSHRFAKKKEPSNPVNNSSNQQDKPGVPKLNIKQTSTQDKKDNSTEDDDFTFRRGRAASQQQTDKALKEYQVILVDAKKNEAQNFHKAKLFCYADFEVNRAKHSKIEIPVQNQAELEVYSLDTKKVQRRITGLMVRPTTSESEICDFVISSMGKSRHLIQTYRDVPAILDHEELESPLYASTEESKTPPFASSRPQHNCDVILESTQKQFSARLELSSTTPNTKMMKYYNGYQMNPDNTFTHVLVKQTSRGTIFIKDDRSVERRVFIYERSHIETGRGRANCYLVTFEEDLAESQKGLSIPTDFVCVMPSSEFRLEPYGYLEGEHVELGFSDGKKMEGIVYFDPCGESEGGEVYRMMVSSKKGEEVVVNLHPPEEEDSLERRVGALGQALLKKNREMRVGSGKKEEEQVEEVTQKKIERRGGELGKMVVKDRRGGALVIYSREDASVKSEDLSESFDSDCFYPDDEIYKVEVGEKTYIPMFKKYKENSKRNQKSNEVG